MTEHEFRDTQNAVWIASVDPLCTLIDMLRPLAADPLFGLCGGQGVCGTCHVHVDPAIFAELAPMNDVEAALLDGASGRSATSRLACQISIPPCVTGLWIGMQKGV